MSLSTHPIWHLKSLGMHRIFGKRNLSKNCSLCSAKQAKRLNKLYRAMALRDQIEACTNAVNMSSFKTVRERQAQTARDCSAASHVFNEEGVVITGYCMMIEITKWTETIKMQNVMFCNTHTNCMYSNSVSCARNQSPKHEENLRWNIVTHLQHS